MAEENVFLFEDLLDERGKTEKDLPKEIRHKIQGLRLSMGQLEKFMEKHPEATEAPQEKIDNLARQDESICAMVKEFLETPSAPVVVNVAPQPTKEEIEAKQKANAEAQAEQDRIAKENKDKADAEAQTQALTQQEQQVKDAMKNDGRIAKATLAQILGREPSSLEKIGDTKVKEYFLNRQVYVRA